MVRPDRADVANTAPLDDLLGLLLRQYKRPLEGRGVSLSTADTHALAAALARREASGPLADAVREALVGLVRKSLDVLAGWGLTYQTSLETGMDAMPGWETTAEFLEIANEKSNAEIRIAAGATLLAALGDLRYGDEVLYLAAHGEPDFDSIAARRVLLFLSNVDADAPDWEAQVRAWLDSQR